MSTIQRAEIWVEKGDVLRGFMALVNTVLKDPSAREELDFMVDIYLRHITAPGVERDLLRCLSVVPDGVDIFEMLETALEDEDDARRLKALREVRVRDKLCLAPARVAEPVYAVSPQAPYASSEAWAGSQMPPAPAYGARQPAFAEQAHAVAYGAPAGYSQARVGAPERLHTGDYSVDSGVYAHPYGSDAYPLHHESGVHRMPTGGYATPAHSLEAASPWASGALGAPAYQRPVTRPVTGVLTPHPTAQEAVSTDEYQRTHVAPIGGLVVDRRSDLGAHIADAPDAFDALYEVPTGRTRREPATTGMFSSLTDYLEEQGDGTAKELDRRAKRRVVMVGAVVVVVIAAILGFWPN